MKEKCENKKSPAQRFGEETARAFSGARDEGEVRSDALGSYTGRPIADSPFLIEQLDAGQSPGSLGRIGPMVLGAESVQFTNPAMDREPTQDADDL